MNIEKIKILLQDLLVKENLVLYDVKFEKEGSDDYLRVFIDKEIGKVSLDEIVSISEKISQALDEVDATKEGYILDVSSAGAEKKILLEKLDKVIDHYIKVSLINPYKTFQSLEGYLLSNDETNIVLQVNFKGRIAKVNLEKNNISKVNHAIKF